MVALVRIWAQQWETTSETTRTLEIKKTQTSNRWQVYHSRKAFVFLKNQNQDSKYKSRQEKLAAAMGVGYSSEAGQELGQAEKEEELKLPLLLWLQEVESITALPVDLSL